MISSTGGIDFIGINKELSFTESNQEHCVDITILKDASDEAEESFTVELTLKYAPFDIPLDRSTVSIADTGRLTQREGGSQDGWMNGWMDG